MAVLNQQKGRMTTGAGARIEPAGGEEALPTASGSFVVLNDKGLHTRPATEVVKCTTRFKAQVRLAYQDMVVNAKSLLGILMLAAARGARIQIEAEGVDAREVIAALQELALNKFNISY